MTASAPFRSDGSKEVANTQARLLNIPTDRGLISRALRWGRRDPKTDQTTNRTQFWISDEMVGVI
jgi:hypothetical protein